MSEQRSVPCINWPCAKGAGHAGPCGTSRDELSSKEQLAEILSDAHAIHCAAEVGMPCDCRVPDAIDELLRRAEPPPSRIGPTEPDDTMVICPVCTSQFRSIPLDVQRVRDELLAIAKQYANECEICGGSGQLRGDGWQKPCDASRASTHADDCWSWGPGHYECAVRKIGELVAELREMSTERLRLRDEMDAMREDAERYRWLRDREIPEWLDLWHQNPDRIDAAIDDDLRQGDQP